MNKVVIVNGTFDLLHSGHLKLLRFAKNLGGFVVAAIDSDELVKSRKGSNRPIRNQYDRKELLEALRYVDMVVVFNSQFELNCICQAYKYDTNDNLYMVKGSDYKDKQITGSHYCKEVIFMERTDESTTKTIKSIITG